METSKSVVATVNWPDGTKLALLSADSPGDVWRIIVRDDYSANDWDVYPGEHWFDGTEGGKPRSLHDWLENTDAVFALGEKLAEF